MKFIITYTIDGGEVKKMRVLECYNEYHARCKFGDYITRHHGVVDLNIIKCDKDIFDMFSEMFGI